MAHDFLRLWSCIWDLAGVFAIIVPRPDAVIFCLESPRLLLTVEEAATYLRISRPTLTTIVRSKQITFSRVRGKLRFRLQWLNDYLDRRTAGTA